MMGEAQRHAATGASVLIFIQVVSRTLTFLINHHLLHYISPELLGAASQYELYSISVLYFARESLQVALLRQTSSTQAAVNVSYFAILLGAPLAYLLAALFSASSLPEVRYASRSLWWYGVASVIELCCEPSFTVVQRALAYKIRAAAQTVATVTRCLVTFTYFYLAYSDNKDTGILPFAYGQMAYAIVLLIIYVSRTIPLARSQKASLLLRKPPPNTKDTLFFSYFSRNSCILAANMYLQTALKYILTQGDSFLVASLMSLREQGVYALASNYGALIARMLFQPIEESSRGLYARLCAAAGKSNEQQRRDISLARQSLYDTFQAYNLLALLACSLGPNVAPVVLNVLTGSKWAATGAGLVLGRYCYYVPLLALNGVSEAFVAAVATSEELRVQSLVMAGYSLGFACAAYIFLGVFELGAEGLIWANCVNMILRILWNVHFIKGFFNTRNMVFELAKTLPSILSIASAVGAAAMLHNGFNFSKLSEIGSDLLAGVIVSVILTILLLIFERSYLTRLLLPLIVRNRPTARSETQDVWNKAGKARVKKDDPLSQRKSDDQSG